MSNAASASNKVLNLFDNCLITLVRHEVPLLEKMKFYKMINAILYTYMLSCDSEYNYKGL